MGREDNESVARHSKAVREFDRHLHRKDGATVAEGLASGLDLFRDSLYLRMHRDVEQMVGVDSMWMPVSEIRTERRAKCEIELYQVAESAAAVRTYLDSEFDWYCRWLARLRLGPDSPDAKQLQRLEDYLAKTGDERRLAFTDVLAIALPDSRGAPLVLFRLMPFCVEIVTALAFGDHARAREARKSQAVHLPAIQYCQQCRGDVLESGEQCRGCGNPLWKYDWLIATD